MTAKLEDRIVIVTGATKGIGQAACLALAREGAKIVATGRDENGGAETARLVREVGSECRFVKHDIRHEDQWENVFHETHKAFGAPHGVVNNAGSFFVKPLAATTEQDFDDIYRVNVEGTFLGVKHAFRSFARSKTPGAIVNVSSLMGQVGFPDAIAYCASKGAVTAMTKTAAIEGAMMNPRVRVNSLHPGVIWTPMITGTFGDDKALSDAFAAGTPLKTIGLPEYMADAIVYLISDDAAYVTGAELTADGGRGAD